MDGGEALGFPCPECKHDVAWLDDTTMLPHTLVLRCKACNHTWLEAVS